MTVRIAAVGDPGHQPDQQSLARARDLSASAGLDLEWAPRTLTDPARPLTGFDGVWLMAWPQDASAEPLRRAAWEAHAHGIPVVVSPSEPPASFVVDARRRAAYREQWQAQQARAAEIEAAEREPRPYVHQMRGPRYRWWRPLVALAVAAAVLFFSVALLTTPVALLGNVSEEDLLNPVNPVTSLFMNLTLASLIPATMVGLWLGFRRSPRRVLSVAGRMRWRWLGWCVLVVTPLWLVYLAVTWVVFDQEPLGRPEHWGWLVLITLLTTPLQAAGEEIAFRGGLVQGVGAWFRSPVAALVVTTLLSTAAFVAAHGSADPWIAIEIGSLAVAGCWLAWRTGGLEAVIALHVVNNLLVVLTGIVLGGLEESYVSGSSEGSPVSAGMNLVATALVTAVLLWLARRRGIAPRGWRSPALG